MGLSDFRFSNAFGHAALKRQIPPPWSIASDMTNGDFCSGSASDKGTE